ncbi:MAG: DMT family transporter [Candidatus Thalassarchaeaceae archaeon]|nr:DMT family transporter [Candidatus Thalassarchaeaceae archaeon]
MSNKKAIWALLAVTLAWGGTFVWMQQSLDAAAAAKPQLNQNWTVTFFVWMRFTIAALLFPLLFPRARKGFVELDSWKGGGWLGFIVWGGFLLQMFGLKEVTPAVSAFLTSLYVVFTALIGVVLGRQRLTKFALIGVLLATFGAAFIDGQPHLTFGIGEWLTVACAFLFAAHIIATDRITKKTDPLLLTGPMILTVSLLSFVVFLLWPLREGGGDELFELLQVRSFLFPLLLCAIFGSLVALLILNLFQKAVSPVHAAIIYALEPVWAAIFSLIMGLEGDFTFWLPLGAAALLLGNFVIEFDNVKLPTVEEE